MKQLLKHFGSVARLRRATVEDVADVPGFDFRAVNRAGNVAIDVEAYPANAHLLPRLDELTPGIRRNMEESAAVTAEAAADANRIRQDLRDWFSDVLADARARTDATARPMPRPPPVTNACRERANADTREASTIAITALEGLYFRLKTFARKRRRSRSREIETCLD